MEPLAPGQKSTEKEEGGEETLNSDDTATENKGRRGPRQPFNKGDNDAGTNPTGTAPKAPNGEQLASKEDLEGSPAVENKGVTRAKHTIRWFRGAGSSSYDRDSVKNLSNHEKSLGMVYACGECVDRDLAQPNDDDLVRPHEGLQPGSLTYEPCDVCGKAPEDAEDGSGKEKHYLHKRMPLHKFIEWQNSISSKAGHIPYSTKPAKDSMPRKRKNPASGSKPATKPKKQFKGPKLPGIDKPVADVPFVSEKAPTAPKPATSPTPGVGVAKKPKSFI